MDLAIPITGIGMVTAQGVGVEATWQGVLAGRDVLRPWKDAPPNHPLAALLVAQCPELPRPADLPPRLWNKLSRTQQLACIAVDEALDGAKLPHDLNNPRIGLFLATTVCGMDFNERYYAQYRLNRNTADPDLMRRIQPYEVAELIARRHRIAQSAALRQVCLTTCVGSAMAIGNAADAIMQGECDIAIAGGAEAMCRVVLSGFHALKVVSPTGCRPFDLNRPGITVGEGAGILILESPAHAQSRSVQPLAYLRGFGITCDAHHLTAPDPEATQATRAIRDALTRANLAPTDIGYINAHGTGTRDNDAMETRALRTVFGNTTPVSSTKRLTGHTFGAAAAIESILCIQALREKRLPANAGAQIPDPALDLAVIRGDALAATDIRAALCTNFAFGGNNSALLFSTEDGCHAQHEPGITPAGTNTSQQPPIFPAVKPAEHDRQKDTSNNPQLNTARRDRSPKKNNPSDEHAQGPYPEHGTRLIPFTLHLHALGLITDNHASILELLPQLENQKSKIENPPEVSQHDSLTQLALVAAYQAWELSDLAQVPGERIALICVSSWGAIDSTAAYLESMLDGEGRYASPRHFSRSVYSSVASILAIHFGIRGPCQTLAFAKNATQAAIAQARRLLAGNRADRVMIIWAEQAGELAHDLARRADVQLRRKEFARYKETLGHGAIAAVVGPPAPTILCPLDPDALPTSSRLAKDHPFAMDAALALIESIIPHA